MLDKQVKLRSYPLRIYEDRSAGQEYLLKRDTMQVPGEIRTLQTFELNMTEYDRLTLCSFVYFDR